MDSVEFEFVKYEKSKALRRYIVSRKLGTPLIRVAESLCVLFLFGYYLSDVSLVIDVGHGFLLRELKAQITPLSAFLLGNGIVLVIFVLSGGGKACGERDDRDDEGIAVFRHLREELEFLEKSSPGESCPLRMGTEDSPEVTGSEEKIIIFSLSTEEVTIVHGDVDEIPMVVKEMAVGSDTKPLEDETGSPTGCDGKSETGSPIIPVEGSSSNNRGVLGRSNSEVTSSAKRASKTALGMWASENGRVPATGGDHGHSPVPCQQSLVDDLSDEEFNQKVERYIAGKKLLLWEEMVAEQICGGSASEGSSRVVISDRFENNTRD